MERVLGAVVIGGHGDDTIVVKLSKVDIEHILAESYEDLFDNINAELFNLPCIEPEDEVENIQIFLSFNKGRKKELKSYFISYGKDDCIKGVE